MPVVELPDGRVVDIPEEAMPQFEQALAAEFQAAQQPAEAPDIQGAAQAAQQKVADDLSGTQKVMVGFGKVINDVIAGVAQLTNPDVAEEIGNEIKAQKEAYDILDGDEVGLEDLGEILGDASLFALGGTGAATIKGGALLGGLIEGIKATEDADAQSRAEQAAGGAFGGAIGGAVGRAFMPSPAADAMADGALKANGIVDFVVGGIGRAMGMSRSDADRLVMRGASNLMHKGKQLVEIPRAPKPPSGATFKTAVSAKQNALEAARQKELNDLGVDMLERSAEIINSMSSRGRAGVLINETQTTLQDLVTQATKKLPDGRVGLSYGDFVQNMAQFSNKQLKQHLGDAYSKQLRVLLADFKKRADEVVSPEQIAAEVAEYSDLILKGDIKIDEMGPKAVSAIMERVRQAGQAAVQQAARGPALAAQAGTQDVVPGGPGEAILEAAQGLSQ